MKIILTLRGLESALTGDIKDARVDMQAILVLLETMDEAHRIQVQAEPTAKDIMTCLETQYENRSLANKHRLLSTFLRQQKEPTATISQHIGKMKELRAALANMKETYSEDFFQVILINSLPAEYGNLMEQWELVHGSMKNTEFLTSLLHQKEKSVKTESAIFAGKAPAKDWKSLSIEEKKKISKCKLCWEKGHWARECPKAANDTTDKPQKVNVIFNLGSLGADLKDKWILDSGATQHMCNNKAWFAELKIFEEPKLASVGDGKKIPVLGIGNVNIVAMVNGSEVTGTLTNVSFILSLATNLMSVSAAAKRGISASFSGSGCLMSGRDGPVAAGRLSGELYILYLKAKPSEGRVLLTRDIRPVDEWHKVLGHPMARSIEKLCNDSELGIKATGSMSPCGACAASKGTQAPHPSSSRPPTSEVGERVHVDLGTINNEEDMSTYYFLLCKDEYSNYCFLYTLDSKSRTAEALSQLLIDFEHESGERVKCLISDNGSEFVNRGVQLLLVKERVKHITSAPYTPQQNGRIEREMRTVGGIARALLYESKLGQNLSREALKTACYLRNLLPTSKSELTPFERFTKRKPKLQHLVEFGRHVQVLDKGHHHAKLEAKTLPGRVVGFTPRVNTYRVYVPALGRVVETSDVFFCQEEGMRPETTVKSEASEVRVAVDQPTQSREQTPVPSPRDYPQPEADRPVEVGPTDLFQTADEEVRTSTMIEKRRHRPNGKPYVDKRQLDEFFEEFRRNDAAAEEVPTTESSQSYGAQLTQDTSTLSPEDEDEYDSDDPPPIPPHRSQSLAMFVKATKQEPETYEEAMNGPGHREWQEAIEVELRAHDENRTWTVVKTPKEGVKLSANKENLLTHDARMQKFRLASCLLASSSYCMDRIKPN